MELENHNKGFFPTLSFFDDTSSSSFVWDILACFFSKAVSVGCDASPSSSSSSDDSDPDMDSSSSPTALVNCISSKVGSPRSCAFRLYRWWSDRTWTRCSSTFENVTLQRAHDEAVAIACSCSVTSAFPGVSSVSFWTFMAWGWFLTVNVERIP